MSFAVAITRNQLGYVMDAVIGSGYDISAFHVWGKV